MATLDKVTKKCWLHRAKNAEPDLDFFLGFLMDERSEEPHPKKFIIPKVSQPVPAVANEPNNPIAGPSGEANKKKKKASRANSQNRANVNVQIQQANAQAANQPGAANQRARCVHRAHARCVISHTFCGIARNSWVDRTKIAKQFYSVMVGVSIV